MVKKELIEKLATAEGISRKDAEIAVNSTIRVMQEALCAGHRIEIRGFGSFHIKEYEPFRTINPNSGERLGSASV